MPGPLHVATTTFLDLDLRVDAVQEWSCDEWPLLAAAVLILVPGAFLVATSTAASAAATLTVGKPTLVDRVLVNVPVTMTCDVGHPAS